jgi:hypothetical protein
LPDLEGDNGVCNKPDNKQYNLYTWKNPVLKGCAVELDKTVYNENPKLIESKTCVSWEQEKGNTQVKTRQFLNLYVLKPAIDLNQWTNKLVCINRGEKDFDECLNIDHDSDEQSSRSAEILGFLMKKSEGIGLGDPGTDEGITFPRHHTVSLSIDSSPWLFGAYRELGALAASHLTLGDDGSLRLPKNKSDKPKHSEYIAESIKILSNEFQEKAHEFCNKKEMRRVSLCER